ncbi:hypothetical protein OPT61_g7731 [Boeremia exigua]|uniref:Uncharacterized protein n=1 Tax=Boeremia exigua TaxID=749465 RepID=A0ACC2I1G8_9PLEO|nr:hypothetical protein OPT61_g7731 [Boeremia exigua]
MFRHDDGDSSDDDVFRQSYLTAGPIRLSNPRHERHPDSSAEDHPHTAPAPSSSASRSTSPDLQGPPPPATSPSSDTEREVRNETLTQPEEQQSYQPSRAAHNLPILDSAAPPTNSNTANGTQANTLTLEQRLDPVLPALQKLKATRVPPYMSRLQTVSTTQILRTRLLLVGRHILTLLNSEPVERRGALEVELCEVVAEKYWPQEVIEMGALGVMEMYRNALFRERANDAKEGAESLPPQLVSIRLDFLTLLILEGFLSLAFLPAGARAQVTCGQRLPSLLPSSDIDTLPPIMVNLIDLLSSTYALVQTIILPYLGVADVIALTRTCKGFNQLQPVLESTAYNINNFLKDFFSDPIAFRSAQAECGALLCGKSVRAFLQRSKPGCGSLNISVTRRYPCPLSQYLRSDGYVMEAVSGNTSLFLKVKPDGNKSTVCLFTNNKAAVAEVLTRYPFTSSMDIISWNKAYALFPCTAFIKSECYLLRKLADCSIDDLNKLTREGLKIKSISWRQRDDLTETQNNHGTNELLQDKDADEYGEIFRRRRIGDKHTWVMKLDTQGVDVPNIPTDVLESTTFRLRIPRRLDQTQHVAHYKIEFHCIIRHPVLRYQYVTLKERYETNENQTTIDDTEGRVSVSYYSQKCQELSNRLDELTMIELTKIPPDQRPAQYAEVAADIRTAMKTRNKFVLPETWTFYDSDVIDHLDKAWDVQQKMDAQDEALRRARFEKLQRGKAARHCIQDG